MKYRMNMLLSSIALLFLTGCSYSRVNGGNGATSEFVAGKFSSFSLLILIGVGIVFLLTVAIGTIILWKKGKSGHKEDESIE